MASLQSEEKILRLFRKSLKEFRRNTPWNTFNFHNSVDHFKYKIQKFATEPNPLVLGKFVEEHDQILTNFGKKQPYSSYQYDYKGDLYYDNMEQHRKMFGFEYNVSCESKIETNRIVPKPPMAKFYRRCGFKYSNKLDVDEILMMLALKYSNENNERKENMRLLFKINDTNKNGTIDLKEFIRMVQIYHVLTDKHETEDQTPKITKLFNSIDTNKSGAISRKEFNEYINNNPRVFDILPN